MKFSKIILVAFFAFASSLVSAQALRGVNNVFIVIENLSDNAAKCNITKDMLDASVRIPLSNSKLKITNFADSHGYIYVSMGLLQINNFCSGSLRVSFNKFVQSEKEVGEFWNESMIFYTNKNDIRKSVSDDLESFIKQFIAAWLKAN